MKKVMKALTIYFKQFGFWWWSIFFIQVVLLVVGPYYYGWVAIPVVCVVCAIPGSIIGRRRMKTMNYDPVFKALE